MKHRIREVRKAKKMTLDDVAKACNPPTTPQTIGRLETGMRTVSVDWLNRIADALGVNAQTLVEMGTSDDVKVAAILGSGGTRAPTRTDILLAPTASTDLVGVRVEAGVGDYRSGDEIWCRLLDADAYGDALNRDVLVPRPAGRFLFGRLIGREGDQLHLLPPGAGARQSVVKDPAWIAVAQTLVRKL